MAWIVENLRIDQSEARDDKVAEIEALASWMNPQLFWEIKRKEEMSKKYGIPTGGVIRTTDADNRRKRMIEGTDEPKMMDPELHEHIKGIKQRLHARKRDREPVMIEQEDI